MYVNANMNMNMNMYGMQSKQPQGVLFGVCTPECVLQDALHLAPASPGGTTQRSPLLIRKLASNASLYTQYIYIHMHIYMFQYSCISIFPSFRLTSFFVFLIFFIFAVQEFRISRVAFNSFSITFSIRENAKAFYVFPMWPKNAFNL